jgi:hypothetical protein
MRCHCPRCFQLVDKCAQPGGLQYCSNCRTLFLAAPPYLVPPWVLGVLTVVVAAWQIICHR